MVEKNPFEFLTQYNINEPEWVGKKFRIVRLVVMVAVMWGAYSFFSGDFQILWVLLTGLIVGGILTTVIGKIR